MTEKELKLFQDYIEWISLHYVNKHTKKFRKRIYYWKPNFLSNHELVILGYIEIQRHKDGDVLDWCSQLTESGEELFKIALL